MFNKQEYLQVCWQDLGKPERNNGIFWGQQKLGTFYSTRSEGLGWEQLPDPRGVAQGRGLSGEQWPSAADHSQPPLGRHPSLSSTFGTPIHASGWTQWETRGRRIPLMQDIEASVPGHRRWRGSRRYRKQ